MFLSSVSASAFASAVWSQVTRTLTSLGTGAMVLVSGANVTIAASTSLDLRPVAGKLREIAISVAAGAAGATSLNLYDGTTARPFITVAQNTNGGVGSVYGNATIGLRVSNADATNAATVDYGGADWTQ